MNKIFEKRSNSVSKGGFKKGWTMVELCVAMIALAVLVGISIQSLKPKKFLIGPFAYAGVKNLRAANFEVIDKCNKNTGADYEVYGCEPNQGLPDAVSAVPAMQKVYDENPGAYKGGRPSEASIDDPYCYEVANIFSVLGEVNCKYSNGNNNEIKLPTGNGKGANAGVPNFQTTNMVAYYHLESPWKRIVKGASTEGSEDSFNATDSDDSYKQVFIDVNGNDGPNKLGEDQFPIRIYKLGGEIIPGFCENDGIYSDERYTDEGGETYVSRCPATGFGEVNPPNWQDENYPFAYNLYRSYSDEDNPDERHSSAELLGVSYKEAACKGGRHNMLPRSVCDDYKNANPGKYTDTNKYNTDPEYGKYVLKNCTEGELSAFCIVRIARPGMPGLFRLPLL